MTHHQGSIVGQNDIFARIPASFTVKAVMRPDILRAARLARPGIFTVLRHWNDDYVWSGDWQENLTLARAWFNQFIDETFRTNYAAYTMAVSERNEYDSHVLPAHVRATRIMWMQAVSWVWNREYKNQLQQYRPGLPPIQLIIGDHPPGNDLPKEAAILALDNDDILGYHPYVAVYSPSQSLDGATVASGRVPFHQPSAWASDLSTRRISPTDKILYQVDMGGEEKSFGPATVGERSPGDWRYVSGRFHYMEQAWGLKPKWALTEAGPIRDQTGTLALDPLGGWRVMGDRENYRRIMTSWLDDVQTIPSYREGRIVGYHLFTVPGDGAWEHFRHDRDDYEAMVDVIVTKWKPGTSPPPLPVPTPLPITPLSQRDPRWANHVMGADSTGKIRNIGDFGCLVTAWCMMVRQWGITEMNPAQLWEHIKAAGGTNGAYLRNGALATAFPGRVKYSGWTGGTTGLYAQIRANKDRGWITPVRVDFNPTTPQQEEHWVNVIDHLPNDNFTAADPWTGAIITVNTVYGIPGPDILAAQWYEAINEPVPPPSDPVLKNGSFEDGWWDDLNSQIPLYWKWFYRDETYPNPHDSSPWSAFGLPECRVLHRNDLPEHERGEFIIRGDHTFKVFRGHGSWLAGFTQSVTVTAPHRLTIKIFGDLVKGYGPGGAKIWADDPQGRDGLVRIASPTYGEWASITPGQWNTFHADVPAGTHLLIVEIMCPFPLNNAGVFCDDWSLEPVTVPAPPSLDQALIARSLELQTINLNSQAALQKKIVQDGRQPVGNEGRMIYNGVVYALQPAESLVQPGRWVYWCIEGNWGSISVTPG